MVEVSEANEYEHLLEKITALCKGFLLVVDKSIVKACSFCRGLLILLERLFHLMPEDKLVKNPF